MLTEEDLKNININNYEGTRYQRFENGKLVEDLDTRNLFCEIKRRLEEYKILCNEEVLKKALRKIGQNLDEFGTSEPNNFNRHDLEMLYSLAYSLYESGDYEKARVVFQRLVLCASYDLSFWKGLASSLQMLKCYDDALSAWAVLSLMDNKDPLYHLHAAECYASLGNSEEAQKALNAFDHSLGFKEPSESKQELLGKKEALLKALKRG